VPVFDLTTQGHNRLFAKKLRGSNKHTTHYSTTTNTLLYDLFTFPFSPFLDVSYTLVNFDQFEKDDKKYILQCHSKWNLKKPKFSYQISTIQQLLHAGLFGVCRHPHFFEVSVFGFLFGFGYSGYPLHLFIFQDGSGGKTTLLKLIARIMGIDEEDIWSGNRSTPKSLTPNYGTTPPDSGWLSKQKYIGLSDEFFGRRGSTMSNDSTLNLFDYDSMKDDLVHDRSVGLSGKGSIKAITTARFCFASNLKYGIVDLPTFMMKTDPALVERYLVYFYTKQHYEFVEKNREMVENVELDSIALPIDIDFYKHLIIWAQSFEIKKIDTSRLREIRKNLMKGFKTYNEEKKEMIEKYINARLSHHMKCLFDGIVKYRNFCMGNFSEDIEPSEEDYEFLESIVSIFLTSWLHDFDIKKFSKKARVGMLSGFPKEIYNYLKEVGHSLSEDELITWCMDVQMKKTEEIQSALKHLDEWGVVMCENGKVKTYKYGLSGDDLERVEYESMHSSEVKIVKDSEHPQRKFKKDE